MRLRTNGGVVWITGLSGVGKTTLATALRERLENAGSPAVLLDGDQLRGILPAAIGYEREERLRLAMYYSDLAGLIARQGIVAICSTVSLFNEVQAENRSRNDRYVEILVEASAADVAANDRRNVYGSLEPVVGREMKPEFPIRPEMVVRNRFDSDLEATVAKIETEIRRKGLI
jgi:cytidine diphosphoramidate kinase